MSRVLSFILSCCLIVTLSACSDEPVQNTIRLGINPWPGYEFLYLADQKGFFEDEGLDIELVELGSLADIKRVFEQGRIDAMASTIIEAVEVSLNSNQTIDLVLVPDFSNGGDVIITDASISSIEDLRGKRVGVELGLLGSFILSQALNKYEMAIEDVNMVNVEQLNAENQLLTGEIAAIVTYPPFSSEMLRHDSVNQIFSTAEIPKDVVDVVSVRKSALLYPKEWQQKLFSVWQRAIDYAKENPEDAHKIMADREGITVEEFAAALSGVAIIETNKQLDTLHSKQLADNIFKVCQTLNKINGHKHQCTNINEKISPL